MENKDIKALLMAQLQKEQSDLAEFNMLCIAAMNNKWQINKRLLNHLPEGCSYLNDRNNYHIKFPSGNSHLIGWDNTKELSVESLRKNDSCYSNGSESRISQLQNILLPENLPNYCKLFTNLNKAVKQVINAMDSIKENKADGYYNPIYYPLLKQAGISQDIWFKLDDIRKANN